MTGEFYFNDSLRPIAIAWFSIGLAFIAYWYLIKNKKAPAETDAHSS